MAGFSDIIGHEEVISYFRKAAAVGNYSHAYIISGEDGMGKLTLAKAFAMAVFCESHTACGHCPACKQVMTGNHPDLFEIRRQEDKKNITVDQVREEIVATISQLPYQSAHKIYIIDGAEDMNEQAQNALLKTIEEPPSYVIMILLSAKAENLLETIHSRCNQINLRRLKDEQIRSYLEEKLHIEGDKAAISTSFARGNLGKAMLLSDSEEFFELYADTMTVLKNLYERPVYEMAKLLKPHKEEIDDVFAIMRMWYRDLSVFKASEEESFLIFAEETDTIRYFSENLTFERLDRAQTIFDEAAAKLAANVSYELVIQHMLLSLKA